MKHIAILGTIIAGFVILSAWAQDFGLLLYGEADWFLVDHNSPERSLANKLIAPHRHDAEQYLAREITHFVEHVDATFIHKCVIAGFPHFLSISTYFFLAGISILFWCSALRHGIKPLLATLLVGIFLTATPIFMAGTYVRPGHAHAAFWAVALVLFLFERFPWSDYRTYWTTFMLSLAMVWADRQGLFLAVVIVATLIAVKNYQWQEKALAIVSAIFAHTYYYLFIGPKLVFHLTEFTVGKNYQMDVVSGLLPILTKNLKSGAIVMSNNVQVMFGNVSLGIAIGVIALIAYAYGKKWWLPVGWICLGAIMYALIMFHQTAFLWPDVLSSSYYNIFGTSMLLLIAGYAAKRCHDHRWLWVAGIVILGNISALPSHFKTVKSGHMAGFIAGAPHLRAALKEVVRSSGTSTNKFNTLESMHFTSFTNVMKNPMEYRQLTAREFVESSHYYQFVRSEKGLPFGRGGR